MINSSTPYKFNSKGIPAEALDQFTFWYDKKGTQYKITDMSKFHARNALAKLVVAHGSKAINSQLGKSLLKQAS